MPQDRLRNLYTGLHVPGMDPALIQLLSNKMEFLAKYMREQDARIAELEKQVKDMKEKT